MPKQLILLAGLHKTGTTSIQQTCFDNRPALRAAGLIYPIYSLEEGAPESNHGALLKLAFRSDPGRFGLDGQFEVNQALRDRVAQRQSALRDQLAKVLDRAADRVLLAAELVSVFSEPELVELRDWLTERGFKVKVICHVRHLSTWVPSMVAQRVKGPMRMTIASAIHEMARAGLVRWRIENIRAAFPDAEIRSFEAAAASPAGLVGSFLQGVGVPPEGLSVSRANEARSDTATRTLSKFNETQGRFDAQGREKPGWTGAGIGKMLRLPGPRFALTPAEIAPLEALIADESRWLAATFGAEFADPATVR